MSGTVISPTPLGKVGRLLGKRLRAHVALADAHDFVTGYEIELSTRAEPDSPAWDDPRWRHTTTDVGGGSDGPSTPERPKPPMYVSLGGCHAERDMRVAERRPAVILRADEPIRAYDWELIDDLVRVDRGRDVTTGISADGLWFRFVPAHRLRRTGQTRKVRLEPGVFKPPFEPPRDRLARPRVYKGITYPGHSEESIDFNRGTADIDEGDVVYAAAKGTVIDIRPENGAVFIEHAGGWVTVYGHMKPIAAGITVGARVEPTTRLGRLGDKYLDPSDPDATISPHLHHQQVLGGLAGAPKPMKFDGRAYELESAITGWRRPTGRSDALLRVRVRRASDGARSRFRKLRFEVAGARGDMKACPDIDHVYDGEEVPAGDYSLRYRVRDSRGELSDWAFDHSLVVKHGTPL